jgi:two-component system, LytTR family, response regulator LytT
MNILIVEDEALAAERLEEMILQSFPGFRIIGKTTSILETIKWLNQNHPDLIFLDIQLSDGLSFSIFEQVQVTTPVIFTTAYDQYAIRAFQLNSVSYLLKPVKKVDLEAAVNKYRSLKQMFSLDLDSLLAAVQGRDPGYRKRFVITVGDKIKKVDTTEIAYFYALERYVFMRTAGNHSYPVEYTLDNLTGMLDPAKFFRINRKYLVSMDAIKNMVAWSRSRVKLELHPKADDEMETIVSIDRAGEFKKWLNG